MWKNSGRYTRPLSVSVKWVEYALTICPLRPGYDKTREHNLRTSLQKRLEDVEVGVEGRHDVARVRLQADARQARHGARHRRLSQEAEEANPAVGPEGRARR